MTRWLVVIVGIILVAIFMVAAGMVCLHSLGHVALLDILSVSTIEGHDPHGSL